MAELAVVLVIVGLLLGGLFVPLSAQNDIRQINDTQKTLNDVRDALMGFAAAHGRLPCPASSTSNGTESPSGGGGCTNSLNGFVPAVTLGVGPTDSQGYVIDAWGNPIRYVVTTANGNAFTTAAGMHTQTMATLAPDLRVCTTAACTVLLTNIAPALVFSTGKEGASAGRSGDELANLDGNTDFVSHDNSTAAGNEFDDIVIWISPNTLYNRMIAAGQLP